MLDSPIQLVVQAENCKTEITLFEFERLTGRRRQCHVLHLFTDPLHSWLPCLLHSNKSEFNDDEVWTRYK